MTDKIFLVKRSFSKEKSSGKDELNINRIINKNDLIKASIEHLSCKEYREESRQDRLDVIFDLIEEVRDETVSLMHVSSQEKCVELTPKELELIKDLVEEQYRNVPRDEWKALLKKLEGLE